MLNQIYAAASSVFDRGYQRLFVCCHMTSRDAKGLYDRNHTGLSMPELAFHTDESQNLILNFHHIIQGIWCKQVAYIEGAELAEAGAHFVEAHFINELLELKRIVTE